MGLRLKLGLSVVLFVSATLGAVGFLQVQSERELMLRDLEARGVTLLRSFAIPCSVALANRNLPTLDDYVVQFADAAKSMDLHHMAVLDHGGKVVAHTASGEFGEVYEDAFIEQALASDAPIAQVAPGDVPGGGYLEVAVPIVSGLRWGTLKAGFTLDRLEAQLSKRRKRLALVALLVAVGAALIAFLLLSQSVVRPVFALTEAARVFGAGKLDARVELDQKDEMGELASQFNSMADQLHSYTNSLEKLVDERTQELASINEQLMEANEQLETLARTDPLTGLYNRRHFMEQLDFEIRRGSRGGHQFAVIMLDVDHFKHYNDTNGHQAGDDLLQRLSAVMEINLRSTDVIARYGGEEFVVLLYDTGEEDGLATARKLQSVVAAQPMPHEESQPLGQVTISVGIAFHPADGADARSLIEVADQALYLSKSRGRNTVSTWADVQSQLGRSV